MLSRCHGWFSPGLGVVPVQLTPNCLAMKKAVARLVAPALFRGLPDIALAEPVNGRRLQGPGIVEDGLHVPSGIGMVSPDVTTPHSPFPGLSGTSPPSPDRHKMTGAARPGAGVAAREAWPRPRFPPLS